MLRIALLFLFFSNVASASDSLFVKLHFVYGSKPKHHHKTTELKYFGGIHGGHVYMEVDNEIVSFGLDNGQWHVIAHKKKIVGKYRIDKDLVWCGDTGKLKITTIVIPISKQQLQKFKSTKQLYLEKAPYDYAFIGMRCAAGAYDMLCKSEVCQRLSRGRTITKYFYPKKLRKRLLKRADKENWLVLKQEGRTSRKWEKD
jgi:hypothetical protein